MKNCLLLIISSFFIACQPQESLEQNPPAPGFNIEQSDQKAIKIADQVMDAMGGRNAWDNVSILEWNFFGSRKHVWNKKTNQVRIEGIKDTFEIDMNLITKQGTLNLKGEEIVHPDSLDKYMQKGLEMWINDSYWIVMPFKLKDSGVTLKYVGEISMSDSTKADQLALTFNEVGVTPQNKYVVSVDQKDHLIKKWDFYTTNQDTVPRFSTPWEDYQQYGEILLSSSRGVGYTIGDIKVKMNTPSSK